MGGRHVGSVEGREIEPLTENENVRDDVATAASDTERKVVTTGARIRIRRRDTVEVSRKFQWAGRIAQCRPGTLGERPAAAFFDRPHRCKQPLSVIQQITQRDGEFLAVLQVTRDSDFAPDRWLGMYRRERGEADDTDNAERTKKRSHTPPDLNWLPVCACVPRGGIGP